MTTSAKTNKYLSLEAVADAVANDINIVEVREQHGHLIRRKVIIKSATVLKKITRHEHLTLYVQSVDSPMTVFAQFTRAKDALKVVGGKIRKSSRIALVGELVSFGNLAVCLNNCRVVKDSR
ncbi:hypothetical protein BH10ACI1_BH10ACI1_26140 [soil metagenome]